jgi:hypothetical protein
MMQYKRKIKFMPSFRVLLRYIQIIHNVTLCAWSSCNLKKYQAFVNNNASTQGAQSDNTGLLSSIHSSQKRHVTQRNIPLDRRTSNRGVCPPSQLPNLDSSPHHLLLQPCPSLGNQISNRKTWHLRRALYAKNNE